MAKYIEEQKKKSLLDREDDEEEQPVRQVIKKGIIAKPVEPYIEPYIKQINIKNTYGNSGYSKQ